jgi:hypothetical protein
MNCISGSTLFLCLFACSACDAPASETDPRPPGNYQLHYSVALSADPGMVTVKMDVRQSAQQLREINFPITAGAYSGVKSDDGILSIDRNRVSWQPGVKGGSLRWNVRVTHRRNGNGYDAWLDQNWGIFRAEDIIPRARSRTAIGSLSETSLSFELPRDWSAITEYSEDNNRFVVDNPDRRFDQPRGWIAIGNLGVRRETIAETQVAVAGPKGESVRRMDMLALLNWVLPELNALLPNALPRLTIISAGDPMWRGGLSAPASLYIHSDRPLISENATSTLVHELVHVTLGLQAEPGFDWIVEGLAEYYSLDLLRRSGAITERRYSQALDDQRQWAKTAKTLCAKRSSGASTALAVTRFRELDIELRRKSSGQGSIDAVVTTLTNQDRKVTLKQLKSVSENIAEGTVSSLQLKRLPGCSSAQTGE